MILTDAELYELKKAFKDAINYESDDPEEPIDPLTYRDSFGDNCLHIAAYAGDERSVELLLKAGLDVNLPGDMGSTALHSAKKKGYENIVRILLRNGALENIKNDFGEES